ISNNSFNSDGRAILLFNTHNSSFHDNIVPNATLPLSAAIRLDDNNSNLSIFNNNLLSGVGYAIHLSFFGAVGGPSSGIVIHENNIGVVGPANFALDGLAVDP